MHRIWKNTTITDSFELWLALKNQAGLDTRLLADGDSYDGALVSDIQNLLFPGSTIEFEWQLKRDRLSIDTTDLVYAFFSSLSPFVQMQTELLNMLGAASANRTDQGLLIEFDFYRDSPMKLSLKEFKAQVETFKRIMIKRPTRFWNFNSLWSMAYVDKPKDRAFSKVGPERSGPAELAEWLDNFARNSKFQPIPVEFERKIKGPVLDRVLLAIGIINEFIRACQGFATTHDELRSIANEDELSRSEMPMEFDIESAPVKVLWQIESDFWPRAMVQWGYDTLSRLKRGKLKVETFCENFDNALPPVTGFKTEEELLSIMKEVLNLPIWKKRHEVYAAWVGSQIWRAMSDWICTFHPVDGTLSFSFKGVHLATFTHPKDDRVLAFWTELRTAAVNLPSGKRKGAIQPDYRIQQAPFSSSGTDVAIVEVKQYRKSSVSNFAAAINDYAFACRSADVHLVNYGPIGDGVEQAIDGELISRVCLVGFLRPNNQNACDAFYKNLRRQFPIEDVIENPISIYESNDNGPLHDAFKIVLKWNKHPSDLDLLVVFNSTNIQSSNYINFQQPNLGSQIIFDKDVQSGYGPETISIEHNDGKISILVHCYTEPDGEFKFDASIDIVRGTVGSLCSFASTLAGNKSKRYWHVCDIDLANGILNEVNEVVERERIVELLGGQPFGA